MPQANAQRPEEEGEVIFSGPRLITVSSQPPQLKYVIAQTSLALVINYVAFYLGRRLVRWVVTHRHG